MFDTVKGIVLIGLYVYGVVLAQQLSVVSTIIAVLIPPYAILVAVMHMVTGLLT